MKVSVCLATYNGAAFITELLVNILKQLRINDEIIIVDDCSRDDSTGLIEGFQDNRIKLYRNKTNKGSTAAFFKAISLASGELIFLTDQDDKWKPNKVEEVLNEFYHSQFDILIHNAEILQKNKIIFKSLFKKLNSKTGFIKNLCKNSFIGSCLIFRAELKSLILPQFYCTKHFFHDYYIGMMGVCFNKKIVFFEAKLISIIRHESNQTVIYPRKNILNILLERMVLIGTILINLVFGNLANKSRIY